jgi:hypothetical protein
VEKVGCGLNPFFFWILGKMGSLFCDGLRRCHDTCNTEA